jgi:hypothetical protein
VKYCWRMHGQVLDVFDENNEKFRSSGGTSLVEIRESQTKFNKIISQRVSNKHMLIGFILRIVAI